MTTSSTSYKAQVVSIDATAPTQQIHLEMPAEYTFLAGQYLCVLHVDGTQVPLSIASPPSSLPQLELHYKSIPGDPAALAMDELLQASSSEGAVWQVSPAQGSVRIPDTREPLLVVAAGSGASLAFCAAAMRNSLSTHVLWTVEHSEDAYALERLQSQAGTEVSLVVDATLGEDNAGMRWLAEHAHPARFAQVIISGSPAFTWQATDVLEGCGYSIDKDAPHKLQSDVYDYAPRGD